MQKTEKQEKNGEKSGRTTCNFGIEGEKKNTF